MRVTAAPPDARRSERPGPDAAAKRGKPRGRPALLSREQVLQRIQTISREGDGLFRVHRNHPGLYARARRLFGSWAEAVRRAGLDYEAAVHAARVMSRDSLRKGSLRSGAPVLERRS